MLDFQNPFQDSFSSPNGRGNHRHVDCFKQALKLFEQARSAAALYRLKNALRRRVGRLLDLNCLPSRRVSNRHYGGIRAVLIEQIHGTLGRSEDFDDQFNPLDDRSRDRWVASAMLRFQGQPLDAVKLIQVGDRYFVEDGHHRISVAHALGQAVVDAEVTVWEVSGALPWEAEYTAGEVSTCLPDGSGLDPFGA
ncbi:hypothetical protein BECAL_00598 [Bellilinea caldifistulae]|uniref:hypothetical protein n=1 Tax=Bellilinea caldifistulae TaxID=360411 RepID=UPI000782903B|nr:hypothetical protein [Bellilinea caldifistulae]GAP09454.1 hypothetical protein BECAL_00598 [Bellilinea caldifistulae]